MMVVGVLKGLLALFSAMLFFVLSMILYMGMRQQSQNGRS